jgi:hypothetical protein
MKEKLIMSGFYIGVSILLLFVGVIMCGMFMHKTVAAKAVGKDQFKLLGVNISTPESEGEFILWVILCILICVVTVIAWPIMIPIFVYWIKFTKISQSSSDE